MKLPQLKTIINIQEQQQYLPTLYCLFQALEVIAVYYSVQVFRRKYNRTNKLINSKAFSRVFNTFSTLVFVLVVFIRDCN